jgi:hypothetical protein
MICSIFNCIVMGDFKMIRSVLVGLLLLFVSVGTAAAQNCGAVPNTLTNGTNADATAVMGNFAAVVGCVNNLALPSAPSGRLSYVTASAIKYVPFNGNQIKISGVVYAVPATGIVGCANTGVFVNGTAAQNLAASTLYYVYAFVNSGTLTCDFSTTSHVTSSTAGNVGTEIETGNDSRSLIGMIQTNSSSQFVDSLTQRFVRSWFNRQAVALNSPALTASVSIPGSLAEITSAIRTQFLIWADEVISTTAYAAYFNNTSGTAMTLAIAYDTVVETNATNINGDGSGGARPITAASAKQGLSEGSHYVTLQGSNSSGTASLFLKSWTVATIR